MLLFFRNTKCTVRTVVLACSPVASCRKLEICIAFVVFYGAEAVLLLQDRALFL